jgi:hypothetical protein
MELRVWAFKCFIALSILCTYSKKSVHVLYQIYLYFKPN